MTNIWFPVAPGITALPNTPSTSTVNVIGLDDAGQAVVVGTQTVMTAPGVVPPFSETVVLEPTVRTALVATSYPYSLSPTVTSVPIPVNTTLSLTALYPKEQALITHTRLAVTTPPVRVSGTAAPLLGNGQVSPTTAATNAGWTLVYNSAADEAKVNIYLPFAIYIDSTAHQNAYVTSNSYVSFSDNNVVYQNLGASAPSSNKIHIGADDFSYQRVYTKTETYVVRIRWEGNSDYGASAGDSNRFFELNFWMPIGGTQLIEIRSGNISGGTSGPFMLANGTTALATGTFAANESWVFQGNSTGTTWTLYTGQHVE